jgi:hypothetical protein
MKELVPYLQIGFQLGLIGALILLPWKDILAEDVDAEGKRPRHKKIGPDKKIGQETGKLLKNCQLIGENPKSNG